MHLRVENLEGLDKLADRFRRLVNPDAGPLMVRWTIIIEQDNRRGILAGTDARGEPLLPVTYRPIVPKWDQGTTARQRNNRKGSQRGEFGGFGAHSAGLHNNLTPAEYRRLGGPPLAPRGKNSRVITNLKTEIGRTATGWQALGYWDEVVTVSGRQFLHHHFQGVRYKNGVVKVRDLAGVRPAGVEKARAATRAWAIDMVRSGGV